MRAVRSIALLALATMSRPVSADPLHGKICIVGAAQNLPSVPGLQIVSSSFSELTAPQAAALLWRNLPFEGGATDQLEAKFGFIMDDATKQAVKTAFGSGLYQQGGLIVINALAKALEGGARVEIAVKAAGQDVTFGSVCGWNANGGSMSVSTGIVR